MANDFPAAARATAAQPLIRAYTVRIYEPGVTRERAIEAVTDSPVELAIPGIAETEEAQRKRWGKWAVIQKQGLR